MSLLRVLPSWGCPLFPDISSRSETIPPFDVDACIIEDMDDVFDIGAAIKDETEHFRET